jgi:hypothetical protein
VVPPRAKAEPSAKPGSPSSAGSDELAPLTSMRAQDSNRAL